MSKIKRIDGFTLIELLIAMSVISLIAMAFFTFLNSSIKFNTKNEKDIKALNIAQSEIENIRQQIKSKEKNLKSTDKTPINSNGNTRLEDMQIDGDNHKYDVDINLQCVEELYTIKVKVSLDNRYFSKKSTELITEVFGG